MFEMQSISNKLGIYDSKLDQVSITACSAGSNVHVGPEIPPRAPRTLLVLSAPKKKVVVSKIKDVLDI